PRRYQPRQPPAATGVHWSASRTRRSRSTRRGSLVQGTRGVPRVADVDLMLRRSAVVLLPALGVLVALTSSAASATQAPVLGSVGIESKPSSATVKWHVSDP